MKKLMVMLGAVAMAAGLQAATISWSSQNTILCDGSGNTVTKLGEDQSVVLIALDSITADWTAGTWKAAAGEVTEYQAGTIGTMGASSGKVGQSYVFGLGTTGQPANGTILAMVFKDDDGSYRQLAYYDSTKTGGIGAAMTETATVSGLAADTDSFTASFGSATSSKMLPSAKGDVPEPTSALLMPLGVAGLALRRRRA